MSSHSAVEQFFADDEWTVQIDDRGVALFAVQGESGEWYGQVWWLDATEQLLVYSILPFPVPEASREAMAAVMGRANAVLSLASFEIDLADGESRCRTGVAVATDRLDVDLVRRAVHANVFATDRFLPALVQAAAGADPSTISIA